jgi:hypothetical protein
MICIKKSAKREKSDEYSVYTVMFLTYSSPQVGKKSFVGEFFYTGGTFGIKDPANVSEIFEFFCVIFLHIGCAHTQVLLCIFDVSQ